jgi:hypothetical protein
MWNVKTKVIPVKNMYNWNDLKIIQKIPEKSTGKELNKGTTENWLIRHCTRTSASTKVEGTKGTA